ncbi:Alpha/Beta hydrolase protein, partial [Catenaria anguillulae PL171]
MALAKFFAPSKWLLKLLLTALSSYTLYAIHKRRQIAWNAKMKALKQSPDFVQRHAFYAPVRGKPTRLLLARHPLAPKAPTLVFIHGFGGNMDQFSQLMDLFSHVATVAAIDLVGHGYSPASGKPNDYTTQAFVADLANAINTHLAPPGSYSHLVIVAHSYGCCLATHLLAAYGEISQYVRALVLMTPKAIWTDQQRKHALRLASLPATVIDLLRMLDRRGNIHSTSVRRFVGPLATDAVKWRQLAWNQHLSSTQIKWINFGMTWASPADYGAISCPTLLLGGQQDTVTPADPNLAQLYDLLSSLPTSHKPDPIVFPNAGHQIMVDATGQVHAEMAAFFASPPVSIAAFDPKRTMPQDPKDQKWNLKNYAKWVATPSVGNCLDSGTATGTLKLRGMKVLRETDTAHSPTLLALAYPNVKLVVDFTSDRPPYDPRSLQALGIQYRKVKTTSKVPPSRDEVDEFLLVLRDFWNACPEDDRAKVEVVCHCHYGFNRTGFMLACWLVQEQGVPVGEAIERVASAREPGIKHVHFKDELFLRYAPRQRVRSLQARAASPSPPAGTTLTSAAVSENTSSSLLGSIVNVVRKIGSRDPSPERAAVASAPMSPTKVAAGVPLPLSPERIKTDA